MQLDFIDATVISTDMINPTAVHMPDNSIWGFRVVDGRLEGSNIEHGPGDIDYSAFELADFAIVTADQNMSLVRFKNVPRLGIYGVWHQDPVLDDNSQVVTPERHRLAIWEGGFDPSDYLIEGTLTYRKESPIAQLTLRFENPDGAFVGEEKSLFHPGAEIELEFTAGDSDPYPMGTYFADRAQTMVPGQDATVEGRNKIGKLMKDQSLDEATLYPIDLLSSNITSMMVSAGLVETDDFIVQPTSVYQVGMQFPNDISYLEALNEWIKTSLNWTVVERTDGKIVVGSTVSFTSELPTNSKYTFNRGTDVFSRSIERDDMDSYSRVCVASKYIDPVTEEELEQFAYAEVTLADINWQLPPKKTLYVQVADETPLLEMQAMAADIADRLATAGTIETFIGPFRPYLLIGDEAEITSDTGAHLLGTITTIDNRFGKVGYATEFRVDSGGRMGKPMITDYIKQMTKGSAGQRQTKRLF